jgi:hypothetical protein
MQAATLRFPLNKHKDLLGKFKEKTNPPCFLCAAFENYLKFKVYKKNTNDRKSQINVSI